MKGCTSVRPETSLEPAKPRPELASLDWVCLSRLSFFFSHFSHYPSLVLLLTYVLTLAFPAEPPVLAHAAPIITTGIGQSLSIPCMLLDGIPLPERHWSQNGKPVRLVFN